MQTPFRITFDALEYTFVCFTCFRTKSQQFLEGTSYATNSEDKLNETNKLNQRLLLVTKLL